MKFLVTGAAGFIGFHVSKRLLNDGHQVVGIDNINDYYDVKLKESRLEQLESPSFTFYKLDLADRDGMAKLFETEQFEVLSILRLKRVYVIHSKIHMLMQTPI